MKILNNLLITITLFFLIIGGIFHFTNNGTINKPIKNALQYYFNFKGIHVFFSDFSFKDGTLKSSKIRFNLEFGNVLIENLKIQNIIAGGWKNPVFSNIISPIDLTILDKNERKLLTAKLTARFCFDLFGKNKNYDVKIKNVKLFGLTDIENMPINSGNAHFQYNILEESKHINFNVSLGENISLQIDNSEQIPNKINLKGTNIPLEFYKIAKAILPTSKIINFFDEFIAEGHIREGSVIINLDKKFRTGCISEENLSGKIKIEKMNLNSGKVFPSIKNMNIILELKGSESLFYINRASSSKIKLSDGRIKMDWNGVDNTVLSVKVKAHAPVKSLTKFIPEEQHRLMGKTNIDMQKIRGEGDVDINIEIPLNPGFKKTYNILANIPDASLSIFKTHVKLRKAKLSGIFNGDQLLLNGTGIINGFKSDLSFIYNVNDGSPFNHKLNIKTRFKTSLKKLESEQNKKTAFITFLGGDSVIDIDYVNNHNKGLITVNSDISNLDLYFDKLGIHKKKNEKAQLIVNDMFNAFSKGVLNFSIIGDKRLNIQGSLVIEDETLRADIQEIKHKDTNLSAKILLMKDFFSANLKGKTLDLSEADMIQFLKKEKDRGPTTFQLNVDKVKLKNNIVMDDLSLMFKCDKYQYFSGYLDSKIGTRNLEILLSTEGEKEHWIIKCNNAGALLRGLGAYDSMKSGIMTLSINTSRKQIKPGQIIPILNGTFCFERFVLHDTPLMTRLISVVSFPGFLNILRGNKNIIFSEMTGKFSFENNLLKIKNSVAEGPYFDFILKGNIDIKNRIMDIEGHVTPELYGISSIIGSIPLMGKMFKGNKKHRGLISASYRIKESY